MLLKMNFPQEIGVVGAAQSSQLEGGSAPHVKTILSREGEFKQPRIHTQASYGHGGGTFSTSSSIK
jgi:hypothetical protein